MNAGPLNRIELRLRSPWLTELKVAIDGAPLTKVTNTASHPELLASGYFRLGEQALLSRLDPFAFSRVLIVLPESRRTTTGDWPFRARLARHPRCGSPSAPYSSTSHPKPLPDTSTL